MTLGGGYYNVTRNTNGTDLAAEPGLSDTATEISTRVVEAVARTSDTPPLELPPLQQAIEADALEALYAHATADGTDATTPTVQFSYAGYEIRIRSITDIEVRMPTDESVPPTEASATND